MAIQFGVFAPQGWRMDLNGISDPVEQYEAMTRVARKVDALPAFDSVWVYDHFHTIPTPEPQTTFEAWTVTAALTRDTQRVNIGQMVTSAGYRNPALLAKMASTVDVMSHGRLYFGLGAGWYEHEWQAYGYEFPETRARMRSFREACDIIMKMWTETRPTYTGEHYRIDGPINEPRGARQPHPSFWIGGGGEQVTLKLVARYADACNLDDDPDTIRRKLEVLRGHCEALGRDYDQIIRSTNTHVYPVERPGDAAKVRATLRDELGDAYTGLISRALIGTPDEITRKVEALVEAGVQYVIFYIPRVAYDHAPLELLAERVAPRFQ
jgi:F420-dependent oxidoreductase-like protein